MSLARSCRAIALAALVGVLAVSAASALPSPAGPALLTGGQSSPGFTSADLRQLRSVGDIALSPDGEQVAYTVSRNDGDRGSTSSLLILDLPSGESRVLADGGSSPTWSPDGAQIAYLGRHDDGYGLVVARADGSEPRFLSPVQGTNHPLPSSGRRLSWAPDGTSIAFLSSTPGPETEDATGDPVVITRYLYKPTASEGLTRFNDNRRMHVFVVEVDSGEVAQLTDGVHYEHSVDWSPAGDEILFISNREPDPDRFFNYDIFAVTVADGSIRRVLTTENAEYRPSWSPDGGVIAYQGTRRGLTSSETTMEDTHVWLVNADGSERREVGSGVDNRQGEPVWAPDGSAVYFTVQERGDIHLYRVPAAGGAAERVIGRDGDRVRSFELGPGGEIVYTLHTPGDLPQLWVMEGGTARQLTDLNGELLDARRVAPVERVVFESFDGLEVEAFLTLPLDRTATSSHPLIAMIHGGPHGQQGKAFTHKAQVYAAHGWATLMVNYRGSTGYGQAFADAIFGDQNGGEAKDVIYGVQAAMRRHRWVDPTRLGVEGGSYGGQLSNWIVTETDMFAAAIPIASISNLISFNYMAYYHDYLAVEFGGYPHQGDLMDVLWERSALKHVADVTTPTMLVHGENDNDVPIAEAEQYYIALHDVGVETVMVRYPREGHGIRETGHVIDLIDRSIAWYRKHFGDS